MKSLKLECSTDGSCERMQEAAMFQSVVLRLQIEFIFFLFFSKKTSLGRNPGVYSRER